MPHQANFQHTVIKYVIGFVLYFLRFLGQFRPLRASTPACRNQISGEEPSGAGLLARHCRCGRAKTIQWPQPPYLNH